MLLIVNVWPRLISTKQLKLGCAVSTNEVYACLVFRARLEASLNRAHKIPTNETRVPLACSVIVMRAITTIVIV